MTDAGVDQNFQRGFGEPLENMNFRKNPCGPTPWCLVFRENLYGPMALKVRQKFPPRLVHEWLFPSVSKKKSKHIRRVGQRFLGKTPGLFQSNLSGDTFSTEVPQIFQERKEYSKNISLVRNFPLKVATHFLEDSFVGERLRL